MWTGVSYVGKIKLGRLYIKLDSHTQVHCRWWWWWGGSLTLPWCLRIQLNSETVYQKEHQIPKVQGFGPTRLSPTYTHTSYTRHKSQLSVLLTSWPKIGGSNEPSHSEWQSKVQVVPCTSDQLGIYQRFPKPPAWV